LVGKLIFSGRIKLPKNTLNGSHQIVNAWILEIFRFAAVSGPFNNEMVTFSAMYLLLGTVVLLRKCKQLIILYDDLLSYVELQLTTIPPPA